MPRAMRVRAILLITVTAALFVAASVTAAATTTATPFEVLGFQPEDSPPAAIDRSSRNVTTVGVDGVNLTGPGTVSPPDGSTRQQLAKAHADHRPAVLLIGNWSNRINDFYEPLAYATLKSPQATARAASALATAVRTQGWNGISVDLESLSPRDSNGLTRFLADLRTDLPHSASLSVCLEAATSLAEYAGDGYDLRQIAATVDRIVLMTYDDNGPWESQPGPIGPLGWQTQAVRTLTKVVPRDKVLLGVADYGYVWPSHSSDNLPVAQVRRSVARAHADARWVPSAGEWTAQLSDGRTYWWSDARSIRLRISLAQTLGLRGIAVWALGIGDPIPGP